MKTNRIYIGSKICFSPRLYRLKKWLRPDSILKTLKLTQEHSNVTFKNINGLFILVSFSTHTFLEVETLKYELSVKWNITTNCKLNLIILYSSTRSLVCIWLKTYSESDVYHRFVILMRFKTKGRFVVNVL